MSTSRSIVTLIKNEVMEFESAQSNTTAKLPHTQTRVSMRIVGDKNQANTLGTRLISMGGHRECVTHVYRVPQTAQDNGTSVTKILDTITAEEKDQQED
ncbi:hypothetical protein Tco_0525687 [Tanacetum coccineum]